MRKGIFLVIAFLLMSNGISFGQKAFGNCSAVFLNNKMVASAYSDNGKSELPSDAMGTLTVCTAEISSPKETKAIEKILFKVAIRDKRTNTLTLFSARDFSEVSIQNVLKKCAEGDHIVLVTTDSQYALPHNEILVL